MSTVIPTEPGSGDGSLFPPTLWSAISAARSDDAPRALAGLERLARAYWRPLYIFVRQRGQDHERAADLVQGFFAHLLTRDFLRELRPSAGRFRSFLLVAFRRWLRDLNVQENALKRGGGRATVPLDALEEMRLEPVAAEADPETAFDRAWAQGVFDRAFRALKDDWAHRSELFAALRLSLEGRLDAESYADLATRLGMTEGAVKKAAFDLRRQFAERVRAEIRSTVHDDAEVEDELRHLVALLRR